MSSVTEYRSPPPSGLGVRRLRVETATFGNSNELFPRGGPTRIEGANRMLDLSLDRGFNFCRRQLQLGVCFHCTYRRPCKET